MSLELVYFLKQMIKKKFYDAILMDAEYAEFGLFPYITRGGQLDENGIVVCQWNMEVRSLNDSSTNTNRFIDQLQNRRNWVTTSYFKYLRMKGLYWK